MGITIPDMHSQFTVHSSQFTVKVMGGSRTRAPEVAGTEGACLRGLRDTIAHLNEKFEIKVTAAKGPGASRQQ
jgi:hypothetical protein